MLANEKIAQFVDVLDRISQSGSNVPGLIMSSPGFGKTSTIEMYCKFRGYNLTTLIASQYAPDDILGLQAVNNGRLERLTPSWFNDMVERSKNGHRNILFIDEITTCDDFIQAPLMNLIFTRKLNSTISLPENTTIIAAGNYPEQLGNSFKLSLPIVNRFLILNLCTNDYSVGEVFDGMFEDVGDDEIEAYLNLETNGSRWSYVKIKNYLASKIVGEFGEVSIQNSAASGLIGFTSLRSLTYSLKFLSEFCNNYTSDLWVQVVGDSLGSKNNLPIRTLLGSADVNRFYKSEYGNNHQTEETIEELLTKIKATGGEISPVDLAKLRKLFLDNPEDVTDSEVTMLSLMANSDKLLTKLLDEYIAKISS